MDYKDNDCCGFRTPHVLCLRLELNCGTIQTINSIKTYTTI